MEANTETEVEVEAPRRKLGAKAKPAPKAKAKAKAKVAAKELPTKNPKVVAKGRRVAEPAPKGKWKASGGELKAGGKIAMVVKMLNSKDGATITEIHKALCWS